MRTIVLSVAELELVEQWFEDYADNLASDPLGGKMMSVEAKLGDHIRKALKDKVSWEISDLEVGWILEWAERSTNPTHGSSRLLFGHESDLIDKLNLM